MSKFKFELNSDGVKSLLLGEEMKNVLNEYGQRVAKNTGKSSDYEVDVKAFKTRASARIACNNQKALSDNLKNNTLLKALGASNDWKYSY